MSTLVVFGAGCSVIVSGKLDELKTDGGTGTDGRGGGTDGQTDGQIVDPTQCEEEAVLSADLPIIFGDGLFTMAIDSSGTIHVAHLESAGGVNPDQATVVYRNSASTPKWEPEEITALPVEAVIDVAFTADEANQLHLFFTRESDGRVGHLIRREGEWTDSPVFVRNTDSELRSVVSLDAVSHDGVVYLNAASNGLNIDEPDRGFWYAAVRPGPGPNGYVYDICSPADLGQSGEVLGDQLPGTNARIAVSPSGEWFAGVYDRRDDEFAIPTPRTWRVERFQEWAPCPNGVAVLNVDRQTARRPAVLQPTVSDDGTVGFAYVVSLDFGAAVPGEAAGALLFGSWSTTGNPPLPESVLGLDDPPAVRVSSPSLAQTHGGTYFTSYQVADELNERSEAELATRVGAADWQREGLERGAAFDSQLKADQFERIHLLYDRVTGSGARELVYRCQKP